MSSLGEWISGLPTASENSGSISVDLDGRRYLIRFHPGDRQTYPRSYFTRLEPAGRYQVEGLVDRPESGAGVPLIGYRENRSARPVEKWYPPEGIYRSVTAVALPGQKSGHRREVEIRLINRLTTDTLRSGGKTTALASDVTVPWVSLLKDTRPLSASGITSVMRQHTTRKAGFYLMEDYDPKKTPLIFVHGLFSTPLAWAQLTNEVWSDPELRARYQVWHYLYPTHAPALYSARIMRQQLDELRTFLDPDQKDPAMQRSVVIAHSMGGLLSKTLVLEPKDAFWGAVFTRPLASLDITPAERRTLEEAFYWHPRGNVDRVIYCSVPFRGSNLATSWIGRVGQWFVAPDNDFQDFYREIERKNPGLIRDDYSSLTKGKITAVIALKPRQKSMDILADLRPVRGVASHVIAGSHDLFVSAGSSAVPGAESSLTVNAGHGSFRNPQAVAEIIRILKLPPVKKAR